MTSVRRTKALGEILADAAHLGLLDADAERPELSTIALCLRLRRNHAQRHRPQRNAWTPFTNDDYRRYIRNIYGASYRLRQMMIINKET